MAPIAAAVDLILVDLAVTPAILRALTHHSTSTLVAVCTLITTDMPTMAILAILAAFPKTLNA